VETAQGEDEDERSLYSILVVDDEADTRDSLRQLLEGALENVRVWTTPSGDKALRTLEMRRVDLMLVDYRMPRMDGLELLREARKVAPGVDRVMMTAYADANVAIHAINEGEVRRFFAKPVDPAQLLQTVRDLRKERVQRGQRSQVLARGMETLRRKSRP